MALHPQLTFKGQNLDFGLLTDSKVKATLVSEHEIHTNYNFDVTFSSTKDVLVEFPIQSYTKKIILNVTSKALLMSGTKRTLSWDKEI